MTQKTFEVNFDGIVGPTHSYQGLSYGNLASTSHEAATAYPKQAALQGLAKMKRLSELGVRQAVLPPHARPHMSTLHRLGFIAPEVGALQQVSAVSPHLLALCSSASAMWTANAVTMCPSADSRDGKVHITPANLHHKFHRSIEAEVTKRVFRTIFADTERFVVHEPLPASHNFADEGAANHTRFCCDYGNPGVHLFVYGRKSFDDKAPAPTKYPARQTLEASQAVARLHQLPVERTLFIQQNPDAIDAGVFHNDVISTGNKNIFLFHEDAFINTPEVIRLLEDKFKDVCAAELIPLMVRASEVSLQEAVDTYLFNSQIVTLQDGSMALIAPLECEGNPRVKAMLEKIESDPANAITTIEIMDVQQSMNNGGGPACLRNRIVLTLDELNAMKGHTILNQTLYDELVAWVNSHYRDELNPSDLADPSLLVETRTALSELTHILQIGDIYDFQNNGL